MKQTFRTAENEEDSGLCQADRSAFPHDLKFASGLSRIEYYALHILTGIFSGNSGVQDARVDKAIDYAEQLLKRLQERGHLNQDDLGL